MEYSSTYLLPSSAVNSALATLPLMPSAIFMSPLWPRTFRELHMFLKCRTLEEAKSSLASLSFSAFLFCM